MRIQDFFSTLNKLQHYKQKLLETDFDILLNGVRGKINNKKEKVSIMGN